MLCFLQFLTYFNFYEVQLQVEADTIGELKSKIGDDHLDIEVDDWHLFQVKNNIYYQSYLAIIKSKLCCEDFVNHPVTSI